MPDLQSRLWACKCREIGVEEKLETTTKKEIEQFLIKPDSTYSSVKVATEMRKKSKWVSIHN